MVPNTEDIDKQAEELLRSLSHALSSQRKKVTVTFLTEYTQSLQLVDNQEITS